MILRFYLLVNLNNFRGKNMKRSKFLIIGTLLVFALLLAACGSSAADEIAVGNLAPAFELTDSDRMSAT